MRAKEFITETDPREVLRRFDKTRVGLGKSSMFGDPTAEKTPWMGSATYNSSGRKWNQMTSPTFFFDARSEYEARRYIKGRLPKSARNIELTVQEVPDRNQDQEVDEQSPAANAKALTASGLGGNTKKPNKDSPYLKSVRTPTTTYSKDRKKYNRGAPPGANDGFIGG